MAKQQIHFLVEGRVQGVSYRAYTKRQADELQVVGWVRNLRDGRVEGFATGEEASIKELKNRLKKGPPLSRVDRFIIENSTESPDDKESGFRILEDGEIPWKQT